MFRINENNTMNMKSHNSALYQLLYALKFFTIGFKAASIVFCNTSYPEYTSQEAEGGTTFT